MSAYNDNPNCTGDYVCIKADDTTGRRSRAGQINAERRAYEEAHNVTLKLLSTSYSETHGFLSQSAFRYRIKTPVMMAHERLDRATEACIRARYLSSDISAEYADAGHAYFAELQRADFGNAGRIHKEHYEVCRPAIFKRVEDELVADGTIRVLTRGEWLYLAG